MSIVHNPVVLDNFGHTEITGTLDDALPIIRERLGGSPQRLCETHGKPLVFDTHKRGKQSGWVHVSQKSDGWLISFGDVRSGERRTLFVRDTLSTSDPSPGDRILASKRVERAAERAAQQAKALRLLARAVQENHPYLVRKGVKPTCFLSELPVEKVQEVLGYRPHAGDEPLEGRILIAPIILDSKLSTAELIDEQGRKSAIAGGRKSGGYWATGALPETGRVVLAEGVATALSVSEALGEPVVAALSVGNLGKVGRALQRPGRELVIAADLGEGGAPHCDALEAARMLGARLFAPPARMGKGADFNDLHTCDGLDAVRAAFQHPVPTGEVSICPAEDPPSPPEQPFPIDALPETLREAVREVQDYTQAPTVLVAASALTAASVAAQGLADVEVHRMMRRPISLFLLTVAESGERKSTCDRYFSRPLRDFERNAEIEAEPRLRDYRAKLAAWESRRKGLLRALEKASHDGGEPASGSDQLAIIALEHQKPESPSVPRLLYADTTTEALAYSLAHSWPSAGLVTSEAGSVFGGYSMGSETVIRNLALLNQLWDGEDLAVDRRTKESFRVRGARLTLGLQVQPAVLHRFLDSHGAVSRGQGFLARCLLSFPRSTQGTRIAKDPPSQTPGLDAFCRRLRSLLESPLPRNDDGELEPLTLRLTPTAREVWRDYANRTERRLLGDLQGLRDVGSKAAENVARLAAVMHLFERGRPTDDVGEESVARAARIVDWYLTEARRFFEESSGATDLCDAARLKRWLLEYCAAHGTDQVTCRDARNFGPVRDAKRFSAAVGQLGQDGDAWVEVEGRRRLLRIRSARQVTQNDPSVASVATSVASVATSVATADSPAAKEPEPVNPCPTSTYVGSDALGAPSVASVASVARVVEGENAGTLPVTSSPPTPGDETPRTPDGSPKPRATDAQPTGRVLCECFQPPDVDATYRHWRGKKTR